MKKEKVEELTEIIVDMWSTNKSVNQIATAIWNKLYGA